MDVSPTPTDEEAAAIEMSWPRPVIAAEAAPEPPRWRFSGRWWSKPIPARRDRPW
jgi:hypothetical protein